jgi:glycosyltransferase involved in cell wall biosynthesis
VLLLQPSDREGFGLPVAEAMACGTPVVASDLPALREVGGGAATYCPVGDIARWSNSVAELLRERDNDVEAWRVRRAAGTAQARRFNWPEHARRMMDVYRELLNEIASRDATARPLVFADAKRRGA